MISMHTLLVYRDQLDAMPHAQFQWRPYAHLNIEGFDIISGAEVLLLCFEVAKWHLPSSVSVVWTSADHTTT